MHKLERVSLDLPNIVDIIEIMENYVARIRPPEYIHGKLDLGYRIDNQSVILYEIRPVFKDPTEKREYDYAKATYVKTSQKWRIYWMRADLKWHTYEPVPETRNLKEFVNIVEEDAYHCFKG